MPSKRAGSTKPFVPLSQRKFEVTSSLSSEATKWLKVWTRFEVLCAFTMNADKLRSKQMVVFFTAWKILWLLWIIFNVETTFGKMKGIHLIFGNQ